MSNEIEHDLARDLIGEKRKDRRWRNIRSLAWLLIVIIYAVLLFGRGFSSPTPSGPYVSLVRLSGSILPGRSFSTRYALPAIQKAFADKQSRGVILLINSPGGSAAQASIIHDRILELKKRYQKKVVVVGVDTLASGAYLISTAADKIYVNRDTLTGSIGVVLSSFGFVDAIHKLGITRRLFTAGANKGRLDPFEKLTQGDQEKMTTLLTEVHQNFIQDVVNGRGNRLKGDKAKLFSGDFWTGQTAVKLGLADGVSDVWTVIKSEFKATHAKNYTPRLPLFAGMFKGIGAALHLGLAQDDTPLKAQAY